MGTLALRNNSPTGLAQRLERFLTAPWSLLLAVVLAFFLNSPSLPLSDVDEGAFTEATREMLASGNLVSPTLNGEARHDKPILTYWAQAASVTLLGESELAYRLPSLLAALLWLGALYRFCRRHADRTTAQVAGLVMVLSLPVGIIAKAAIADALLNLFIGVALFGIYDYLKACRGAVDPPRAAKTLRLVYAALALGFLTKGPVAVLLPLFIGVLFAFAAGARRPLARALLFWPGWAIFLALVVPWHVLVYVDQGEAFFRGFYLQHNLARYASTFEGHGGRLWYYALALPLLLLPFTGWLLALGPRLLGVLKSLGHGAAGEDELLDRFLLLWFAVVFIFFSGSRTQLPHYLLYGCTPLFIFLARQRVDRDRRRLLFAPALIFAVLLAAAPWLTEWALLLVNRPVERLLLGDLREQWATLPVWALASLPLLVAGLYLWRAVPAWQGLLLVALVQAALVQGCLLPLILEVTQQPVKSLAELARQQGGPVVAHGVHLPSFSVYRQAVTPVRLPRAGELVLTRLDRLDELKRQSAPLVVEEIARRRFVVLARVLAEARP